MKLALHNSLQNNSARFTQNYSLAFDGTDDRVVLNQAINYTTFSISIWVFVVAGSGNRAIYDGRDGGNDGIVIYVDAAEKIIISINGNKITQSAAIIGAWQHIGVTYNGSTIQLYVNALTVQTSSASTTVSTSQAASLGGKSWTSGQFFDGGIDEVAFFNSVLSENEITTIYEAVNTGGAVLDLTKDTSDYGSSANSLDYYRFEEGSGTLVTNLGSRGVAGTISGAAYESDSYPGA